MEEVKKVNTEHFKKKIGNTTYRVPGMTAPPKNLFPTRGRSAGAFIPTRPTETSGKRSPDRIGKSLPAGKNWTST